MKIVTLNTWSGILHAQLLKFFLSHKEVDIFCLQEIYNNAQGKLRPDETGEYALDLYSEIASILDSHLGFFSPLLGAYYGLAIFITKKLRLIEEGAILVHESRSTSHIAEHSRKLQYLRFEYDNREFLLGNVHGLWNGKGKGDSGDRIRQSEAIADFMTSHRGSKILCGDLNLAPDTESVRILEQNMRNLITEHEVNSTRTSYYSKAERFSDYIFVSPDISVGHFDVLPEQVSDHSALYLEIT
jgi:endonuclease/exonuclease/phosphatase family metal-dependent hydrolase